MGLSVVVGIRMPDIQDDRLEEFGWFVDERERIRVRRFVEDQEPPWTEDEILANKHFTNVHRRMDKQTQWFLHNRVGRGELRDVFLNSLMFTVFNRKEGMEEIGFVTVDEWDPAQVLEDARRAHGAGELWNSAYMTTGVPFIDDPDDKAESYIYGVFDEAVEKIGHYFPSDLPEPDNLTDRWIGLPGIQDFLAYEIYCDLYLDDRFPHGPNDYVNPGDGAVRGINRLHGRNKTPEDFGVESKTELNDEQYRQLLEHEHDDINYVEVMEDLQETWKEWATPEVHELDLTLRSVEHQMCEYDKFRRAKTGDASLRDFSSETESWEDMQTASAEQDSFADF
jgi:hypothetical protein